MEGLLSRCIQSGKSVQKHIQSPGTSFWVQPSHPVLCRSPELGSDLKTKSIGVCVVNLGRQSLETKAFGNFLWTVNVVGFPHVEMKARHIHLASVGSSPWVSIHVQKRKSCLPTDIHHRWSTWAPRNEGQLYSMASVGDRHELLVGLGDQVYRFSISQS